jgi:hypothetical protein
MMGTCGDRDDGRQAFEEKRHGGIPRIARSELAIQIPAPGIDAPVRGDGETVPGTSGNRDDVGGVCEFRRYAPGNGGTVTELTVRIVPEREDATIVVQDETVMESSSESGIGRCT